MAIDRTLPIGPQPPGYAPPPSNAPASTAGTSFQQALQGVQLSRHAQKRVDSRDLNLGPSQMSRLDNAINAAAAKGSRNSVVMLDNLAVVVDVNQRTVVTAMNAQQGKEKVFTNIDSVVIA